MDIGEITYFASFAGVDAIVEARGFIAANATQHGGAIKFCTERQEKI